MTKPSHVCSRLAVLLLGGLSLFAGAWTQPPAAPATLGPAAARAGATSRERWSTIAMGGQRAGYEHTTVTSGDGKITTDSEASFVVKRGALSISSRITTSFVESDDHKPISMQITRELGSKPTTTKYQFESDQLRVTTEQQGRESKSTQPLPSGVWLTPAAAEKYIAQRQAAGAAEITVRTVDPSAGSDPGTDTYALQAKEKLKHAGREIDAWRYTMKSTKLPGIVATTWLDERAEVIKTEMSMAGIHMVTEVSTRTEALKKAEGLEIMVATFITPSRPIDKAREITRASYVARVKEGTIVDLPTGGGQVAKRLSPKSVGVEVSTTSPQPATEAELIDPAFLKPATAVDCNDPEIKTLATSALKGLGEHATDALRVERLRVAVRSHITKKDLDSGFASASEACRSKSGDCTEHAVLNAALLRASGIPSRVVSGLIYADQFAGASKVFAYHMWTQALVDVEGKKCWVDTDATLWGKGFDATHIALVTTSLADGQYESAMASIATLLGQLSIDVESTK
ncbi:MAG: transglutaminase-like domain-containing protein [Planctomycetota bacterium]